MLDFFYCDQVEIRSKKCLESLSKVIIEILWPQQKLRYQCWHDFFLSIYFERRELGPLHDWYDNKEQRVSSIWIIWVWQGSSQHCCVGWSLVVWIKSRLVANLWRWLLCGLGKFAEALDLHTFDHSCWKQDNPHIYMKLSVGLFCGPHCGLTSHDLCSTLQRWGNLGWPRASGSIGPTVHLGRPLDGVDSALPGPGPPVTPERGHWGGGQLRPMWRFSHGVFPVLAS